MTNYDDLARWAEYPAWSRAILDEYARAIHDLVGVVAGISPEQYEASTALADEEFPDIRQIMWHVVGAANRYVDYIEVAVLSCQVQSGRPRLGPGSHIRSGLNHQEHDLTVRLVVHNSHVQ